MHNIGFFGNIHCADIFQLILADANIYICTLFYST